MAGPWENDAIEAAPQRATMSSRLLSLISGDYIAEAARAGQQNATTAAVDQAVAGAVGEAASFVTPSYPNTPALADEFSKNIFPDNPSAAAALAATIRIEGMTASKENTKWSWSTLTGRGDAGFLRVVEGSQKPWALKRTHEIYRLFGGTTKKDEDGNEIRLTRKPTADEIKTVQEAIGVTADGAIGPKSRAALLNFQKENALTETDGFTPEAYSQFGVDLFLKDAEGNDMYEYNRPTNPVSPYSTDPFAIANIVYNPYYRKNGYENVDGDVLKEGVNEPEAANWVGRGPVQLTGRANYEAVAPFVLEKTGVDIMQDPEKVATDPSVTYWATKKYLELNNFGVSGDYNSWLLSINPNATTIGKRIDKYNEILPSFQPAAEAASGQG